MKFTNSLRISVCTTVIALLLTLSSFAQVPEKMSYQAVIRGANNALVTNQQVGMKISILQEDAAVYEETQTPTSNANGLVTLEIGTGTIVSGTFSSIDWSAYTYFIKIETDPAGGSNYTITSSSQLLSVPYALYAKASSDTEAVALNTAKVGYTEALVSANTAVAANTAKTGITADQSDAILANSAKISMVLGTTASTALAGNTTTITADQSDAILANSAKTSMVLGTTASTALAGNTTTITKDQSDAILANSAKTSMVLGTTASSALAGNTTTITSDQSGAIAANTAKVGVTTHAIGDNYGGGIVFYVYDGGQHGLIAATTDQSAGVRWYGGSNTNTRARADGIGAGLKNTTIIIANQGDVDANAFAATVCNEYSVTVDGVTYGDWYLPSKYELNLLFAESATVGGFTGVYWSSNERDSITAFMQDFGTGSQLHNFKNVNYNVRAIRAF